MEGTIPSISNEENRDCNSPEIVKNTASASHKIIEESMIIDFETQPNYIDMADLEIDEKTHDEDNGMRPAIEEQATENSNDLDRNSVFDETQSTVSEEIPSPPFETVTPAPQMESYDVNRIVNCDHEISPPPFEEVIDPKSFGTLENDSSISEMENVEKCVNENFHEDANKSLFNECDELHELNFISSNNKEITRRLYEDEVRYNMLLNSSTDVSTSTPNHKSSKRRNIDKKLNFNLYDIPETIVSSTTLPNNQVHIADTILFPGTNNSSLMVDYSFTQKHKRHMLKEKEKELRMQKKSKPKYTIGYIPVPKSKSLSQRGFLSKDLNTETPSSSSSSSAAAVAVAASPSFLNLNRSITLTTTQNDKRPTKHDESSTNDVIISKTTRNRTNKNSFHSVFMDDLFKPEKSSNNPTRSYIRRQKVDVKPIKKSRTKLKKSNDASHVYSNEKNILNIFVPQEVEHLIEDASAGTVNDRDVTLQYPTHNSNLLDNVSNNHHVNPFSFTPSTHVRGRGNAHHDLLPTANCNYNNLSLINQQMNTNER